MADIGWAKRTLKRGRPVQREVVRVTSVYVQLEDSIYGPLLYERSGFDPQFRHVWQPSAEDILAEDWVQYKPETKP